MILRCRSLSKSFITRKECHPALDGVNLELRAGDRVALLGPNGCGKTTLLRLIAGLIPSTSGHVDWVGDSGGAPPTAMVSQTCKVFPWLSVAENVGIGLSPEECQRDEMEEKINQALDDLGLTVYANDYAGNLSAGLQQRVNLARAFCSSASWLLLDEPFASLDEPSQKLLQVRLSRILARRSRTVLWTTHSIQEAMSMCQRIVVMTGTPGKMIKEFSLDRAEPGGDLKDDESGERERIGSEIGSILKKVSEKEWDRKSR